METHRRRQTILGLLREAGELQLDELAARLSVSLNTIRNDFDTLEAEGLLKRVRGGATLPPNPDEQPDVGDKAFLSRCAINRRAKQRIARWAAELVEDGDTILLDASSTVYHVARSLQDRRNLTVITNGVEVGRLLSRNPSNTVLIIGGRLAPGGAAVTGLFGERLLNGLHVKTAFVSCTGFTLEAGLTEAALDEAPLKSKMLATAGKVVALVDSSKFGKVDLTPFASVAQISHIFTDSDLDPAWVEKLRTAACRLTVCGETTVSNITPGDAQGRPYKIGFANLNEQSHFATEVRRGIERAAREAGNIDLILADNRLDPQVALQVADSLIAAKVELAIEYQLDHSAGDVIMAKFQDAGIPVIAIDIPMVGATFFGVDNYRSGHMAGVALGNWIGRSWGGQFDRLIAVENRRAGPLPAARLRGQLDGLESVLGAVAPDRIIWLDGSDETERRTIDVLTALPDARRLAFITFNDSTALGVVAAGRKLGRQADMAVVGQGADRRATEEMQQPDSPLIGATAFFPDQYGEKVIPLAVKILRGEPVPPAMYINHVFVDRRGIAGGMSG